MAAGVPRGCASQQRPKNDGSVLEPLPALLMWQTDGIVVTLG
jgi:hypothetical protein